MNRTIVLIVAALGSVLGTAAFAARSEWVIATGRTVLVEIVPRDPRSLVQGDYHALRYRLGVPVTDETPVAGELAFRRDGNGVLTDPRLLTGPLAEDELRIDYRLVDGEITVAPRSFLIEEGTGPAFTFARYAELRVAEDGTALLVRLTDAERQPLGPMPRGW